MDIIDTTNSDALITGNLNNKPNGFRKNSFSLAPRTLRAAIEHLPFVDARRMKIEKYIFLSFMLPLKYVKYSFCHTSIKTRSLSAITQFLLDVPIFGFFQILLVSHTVGFPSIHGGLHGYLSHNHLLQSTAIVPTCPESSGKTGKSRLPALLL
jgi:hypothetical protein